jgi:mRNA-degrading endonuclease RelE of RelBE toxin-antitoxin system
MPRDGQEQMLRIPEDAAGFQGITDHPDIRPMKGEWKNCYKLRVGTYRSVSKVTSVRVEEVLYVAFIGLGGDAY